MNLAERIVSGNGNCRWTQIVLEIIPFFSRWDNPFARLSCVLLRIELIERMVA